MFAVAVSPPSLEVSIARAQDLVMTLITGTLGEKPVTVHEREITEVAKTLSPEFALRDHEKSKLLEMRIDMAVVCRFFGYDAVLPLLLEGNQKLFLKNDPQSLEQFITGNILWSRLCYGRKQYSLALATLDQSRTFLRTQGILYQPELAALERQYSYHAEQIGDFSAALKAHTRAKELHLGVWDIKAARQHSLGICRQYFRMGEYKAAHYEARLMQGKILGDENDTSALSQLAFEQFIASLFLDKRAIEQSFVNFQNRVPLLTSTERYFQEHTIVFARLIAALISNEKSSTLKSIWSLPFNQADRTTAETKARFTHNFFKVIELVLSAGSLLPKDLRMSIEQRLLPIVQLDPLRFASFNDSGEFRF